MDPVDCVVIGAGVVGLAVARSLARRGREVVVLEAQEGFGRETSSRNSEVIHAGLHDPPDSLKARLCVQGRHALYAYCAERGVAHRRCGKLLVATAPAQHAALERIAAHAGGNGVSDLRWLDAAQARQLEPALHCTAALLSPSSGIVDSHALMLALLGQAQDHGATLALRSPVLGGDVTRDGLDLEVGGAEPMRLSARLVVNCAGLYAPRVAASVRGLAAQHVPPERFCKGSYFSLAARAPFAHLVYPVPEQAGLGVHLTLDLAGQARFGPDTEWLQPGQPIDYRVDAARAAGFYAAIRRYWPALAEGSLVPAYAGVRPKLTGPAEARADFAIEGTATHGVAGLINLFGIESPGLTASLAIGEHVAGLAEP